MPKIKLPSIYHIYSHFRYLISNLLVKQWGSTFYESEFFKLYHFAIIWFLMLWNFQKYRFTDVSTPFYMTTTTRQKTYASPDEILSKSNFVHSGACWLRTGLDYQSCHVTYQLKIWPMNFILQWYQIKAKHCLTPSHVLHTVRAPL